MHILIVGRSYSGKSNLAKRFAADAEKTGEKIIVFDPLKSAGWPASAKLYSGPVEFFKAVWATEKCHVFVDESKVLFTADLNAAEKLAYQGRHGGRLVYFIGQRAMSMIPPNARNQCSRVFAFKQSLNDAKILADEYDETLINCTKLKEGEFLCSNGFKSASAFLDYKTIPPTWRFKQ